MNSSLQRAADPAYGTVLVPLDGSQLAAGAIPTARALATRFGATVHTVTVADSDHERPTIRSEAAHALGTEPDDARIHVEIDTDIAGAVHRCASQFDSCLLCLSTHGRGRVAGTVVGSTARDIIERCRAPVVVAGPLVVPDSEDGAATPPLDVDDLVACVDGTPTSERGLAVVAAWAHALGMTLTLATVAEPCPPPVRIGAPWRRHHGPNEDADEYIRRLGERWAPDVPALETVVVYDAVSAAAGMKDYLADHHSGLIAVTSHLRDPMAHLVFGSGAADIIHTSTAPALVVPVQAIEG
jgi:nucleotide-binding universal stress UspA family protein